MKKTAPFLVLALLGSTPAQAYDQGYSWEVELGAQQLEFVRDSEVDRNRGSFRATYYPQPVRTCCYPLAELAFMNRATGVYASYEHEEKTSQDLYRLGADYYYMPGMYAAAEFSHVQKFAQPNRGNESDTGFTLLLGLVPQSLPQLRLFAGGSINSPDYFQENLFHLGTKFLYETDGGQALNLELQHDIFDDKLKSSVVDLSAEFYFNRHFSVGTGIIIANNKDHDNASARLSSQWFFNPFFSISARYEFEAAVYHDPTRLADIASVDLKMRF
ncbi:MAG: hypothetical protein EA349_15925 [Halomonadaceae bacterium]|nr:MAG: hypothetical protein EA349_15925 [Halomonadaceae bacterium]